LIDDFPGAGWQGISQPSRFFFQRPGFAISFCLAAGGGDRGAPGLAQIRPDVFSLPPPYFFFPARGVATVFLVGRPGSGLRERRSAACNRVRRPIFLVPRNGGIICSAEIFALRW